jgi:hypothetical protein
VELGVEKDPELGADGEARSRRQEFSRQQANLGPML